MLGVQTLYEFYFEFLAACWGLTIRGRLRPMMDVLKALIQLMTSVHDLLYFESIWTCFG